MKGRHRDQVDGLREALFANLGYACCAVCKSDDKRVLEFHHVDRTQKLKGNTRSLPKYRRYLTECSNLQILCANCHAIETYEYERAKQAATLEPAPKAVF